jgi:hypothetical protein
MLWKKQIHGVVEALAYAEGVVALCASDTLQLLRVGDSTQISQVRLPQPMECLHVGSHGVWLGSSRGELWRYHNQSLARVAKLGSEKCFASARIAILCMQALQTRSSMCMTYRRRGSLIGWLDTPLKSYVSMSSPVNCSQREFRAT